MRHEVRRLLDWVHSQRGDFFLVLATGMTLGGLIVFQAYTLAYILDAAFIHHHFRADLYPWLGILLGVIATRAVATWVNEVAAQRLAVRIKAQLRGELLRAILHAGPAYLKTQPAGDLTATLMQGIESLEPFFAYYLPQIVLAAGVPVLILAVVFPLDWLTGIIFLFTAPLVPLFMILIGRMAERVTRRQWRALQRLNDYILDTIQGLVSLKAMGRTRDREVRLGRVSDAYYATTLSVLRVTFLSALAMELISTISTALVAVEIGLRLLYGRLDFLQAFFILLIAPEFYLPLRMLGQRFHAAMSGIDAAQSIFSLLDEAAEKSTFSRLVLEVKSQTPSVTLKTPPQRIRFESVSFVYPGRPELTLQEVGFEIHHGQKVALIGPSGAGKTTLAYLLLGFLQPTQGQIWVDDVPLAQIPFVEWRRWIAWVPQMPYLFNASLAWNVRMSRPMASENAFREAIRQAGLEEIGARYPQEWEREIGEWGRAISGGEAQRVALARAFLKDAPILVMDEPTAHLDPDLEVYLERHLRALWEGRTCLIIAHRLSTIQNADWVLVLDHGRIRVQGKPSDLLGRLTPDMTRWTMGGEP
ncbi:thiol reductant ABC exporter subunit CydD [Thermanaerothrix sp. 4228-RoL]|uniref:Thiol reductant ABC exporter subunit CydD n=1 Tax=Thermanaerothrix solaris TaxID=3058434 RepID=A0ABU3NKN3_9CHLR|nr:thiol reductant ABC exporter subunit CydD [Thermanaerothrix sp. 4228-RoL]MDT8897413.1 thiol reductant ABC exporter subunit CydD [Thermanaerothrix sp. 4228-RoL]